MSCNLPYVNWGAYISLSIQPASASTFRAIVLFSEDIAAHPARMVFHLPVCSDFPRDPQDQTVADGGQ